MWKHVVLPGATFGKWTVRGEGPRDVRRARQMLVRCQCGTEATVNLASLVHCNSHGCKKCSTPSLPGRQTDGKQSLEYRTWGTIKQRCTNPRNTNYVSYGGSGIAMHQAWHDSFDAFIRDVGPRPSQQHTLDRYPNPNGNYEPGNVRWATKLEQGNNRKDTRWRTLDEERIGLSAVERYLALPQGFLRHKFARLGLCR